jgi:hypothetical protein
VGLFSESLSSFIDLQVLFSAIGERETERETHTHTHTHREREKEISKSIDTRTQVIKVSFCRHDFVYSVMPLIDRISSESLKKRLTCQ